jgi:hypothetical protein
MKVLASTALLVLLTVMHTPAEAAGAAWHALKPTYEGPQSLVQKAGKHRRHGARRRRDSNGWPVAYGYYFRPYSGWHYGARYYPWYRPYRRW